MNRTAKAALNMSRLPFSEKLSRAKFIAARVAAYTQIFVTPSPPLANVMAAISDFEAALLNAADGGKTKTAIMHDKAAALLKIMSQLAFYVEMTANGDEEIIHLAGLEVKSSGVKNIPPIKVESKGEGIVLLRVQRKPRAFYKWEYCKDPVNTEEWTQALFTHRSIETFSNLTVGLKYWFRVFLFDSDGFHLFRQPVSVFVI